MIHVHCTLINVHCTLINVHCTLINVHCTLINVYCTLYVVFFVQCSSTMENMTHNAMQFYLYTSKQL